MNLPNAERAVIDNAKLVGYLLSSTHPVGRYKARFFLQVGYTETHATRFEADLLDHARAHSATLTEATAFGRKYEVRGSLLTPSGRRTDLVTVWIILDGEQVPRLITAYPGD
ncbi:MAG: adhesin [Planctomycetes bacterium]|nr:adhesin [Planctomycetota bacterium]